MYYQKRNPYPTDWWGEKILWGISRNALALILICLVLAVAYGSMNWDWVFGLRTK